MTLQNTIWEAEDWCVLGFLFVCFKVSCSKFQDFGYFSKFCFLLFPFTHSQNFLQFHFFLYWLLSLPHLCTSFPDFPFLVFLVLNWQLLCYMSNPSVFFWNSFSEFCFLSSSFYSLWLLPCFSLLPIKAKSLCFKFTLSLSFDCSDPFLKWISGFFGNKSSDATLLLLPPPYNTQWIKVTTKGETKKNLWWQKWVATLLWLP